MPLRGTLGPRLKEYLGRPALARPEPYDISAHPALRTYTFTLMI